jgi:hypothetical protein
MAFVIGVAGFVCSGTVSFFSMVRFALECSVNANGMTLAKLLPFAVKTEFESLSILKSRKLRKWGRLETGRFDAEVDT